MFEEGSVQRAPRLTRYQRPKDFHVAFCVAASALLLHSYGLAADFARAAQFEASASPAIPRILLAVELCLLVSVIGLCVRKVAGLVTSITALLVACASYALWYLDSQRILELLAANPFYGQHPEAIPAHPLGLIGSTWLNLVVLALIGALLAWEAKTLGNAVRLRRPA